MMKQHRYEAPERSYRAGIVLLGDFSGTGRPVGNDEPATRSEPLS